MLKRRLFKKGQIYHICNKSIANYKIFGRTSTVIRFIHTLDFYNNSNLSKRFSNAKRENKYTFNKLILPKPNRLLKIIAFCVMPDHYHLLIKLLKNDILSKYINNLQNSFTRYFNIKMKRKGPLWQSRFRSVEVKTDEQLLHVSRYIHLNPTTANLVNKPEDWEYSSYTDYVNNDKILGEVMNEITIKDPKKYKQFCENNIEYQKKLKKIRKLLLE